MRTHLRLAGLLVLTVSCLALSTAAQAAGLGALVTKSNIDLNGNNIVSDSFDSSDTNKSTNGQYDPRKYRGDRGDVTTLSTLVNVGNANIYGHVATGPGGTVMLGSAGGIGEHTWQAANPGTIEPGWFTQDANFYFPNTDLPTNYVTYLQPTSGYIVLAVTNNGVVTYTTNYYDHILSGGNYMVPGYLTGKTGVTGTNILVLPSGMTGNEEIDIAPGASLQLYVGGTSVFINGNTLFNYGGFAGSLIIRCAPSVTSVSLDSNAGFTCVLFAPNAAVSLNSGGKGFVTDFTGALIAGSVRVNSGVEFHYDEALSFSLPIPPSITTQSHDQVVPVGQNVTFYVSGAGGLPLSYQWLFNGSSISATNSSFTITNFGSSFTALTITNVEARYAGLYSVVVTNPYGSVTSSPAMLTVAYPPSVVGQPLSQSALIGSNVTFSVTATGTAPLSYQWFFNGGGLGGATNSSLTISGMQSNNAGSYAVVVTNAYGWATSSTATLTVAGRPGFLWARGALEGGIVDYSYAGSAASSVVTDPSGKVIVGGHFGCATLDLGGIVLTNNAGEAIFICKYDASGNVLWARSVGIGPSPQALQVAADGSGNAYFAGRFTGIADFGGIALTNTGVENMFVAKFNSQGQALWARQIDTYAPSYMLSLGFSVDADGNAFVARAFSDSANFGTVTVSNSEGFLAKYDSVGNLIWATNSPAADAIVAGTNGAVFLTGRSFGPGFLAQYDALGNLVWSNDFPHGQAIALDAQQDIYTTGFGAGTWDGLTLTNVAGLPDFFVAKCDPLGHLTWIRQIGSTQQEQGIGIALDRSGDAYVVSLSATARQDPVLSFGNGITLSNAYGFVAEYDPAGNARWAEAIGVGGRAAPFSIALSSPYAIYIAGYFYTTLTLGDFTLVDSTPQTMVPTMFVAKLAGIEPAFAGRLVSLACSADQQLQFTVLGVHGCHYAVEASTNLLDWVPLTTNTAPFFFQETGTANFPQRYYRSVYVP